VSPKLLKQRECALAAIKPRFTAVFGGLKDLFPNCAVSGRLRADIYWDHDGILSRDAAGTRVVFDSVAELMEAESRITKYFRKRGFSLDRRRIRAHNFKYPNAGEHIRNPRNAYYKGVHLYLHDGVFPVEVQLRSARPHRIAEWAHGKLFGRIEPPHYWLAALRNRDTTQWQELLRWLTRLAEYYDRLDGGDSAIYTDADYPAYKPRVMRTMPHWRQCLLAGVDWHNLLIGNAA